MEISFKHLISKNFDKNLLQIEIYDKRNKVSENVIVKKISDKKYLVAENSVMNCRLTVGTEFETHVNKNGKHEITKITKDSDFITRRFSLTGKFTETEYRVLGDEIIRQGGFWQVDFGSILTINLPKDLSFSLDEVFTTFDFNPTEITDK